MEEILDPNCESLYEKLKHEEKQLRVKRRFLMGLPVSDTEQEQLTKLEFQEDKVLLESFLREDDVNYETVQTFIQKGFGSCNFEYHVDQGNKQVLDFSNDLRNHFSMLDDMTNNGLQLFAEILTGGSVEFEKTRVKMKKIIREYAPKVLGKCKDNKRIDISEKLSQLIRNSNNFRRKHATPTIPASQSNRAAVIKVLDGLEDMPFQTLSAMHRKLRGKHNYMPQLRPPKSGWGRSILIDQGRKICMVLLAELGEGDELQEPLAKAMAVGSLWSKLIQGCPFGTEFWKFSPKIEALQNEIATAICVLKEKVTFSELKNLQLLLDPNAELSNRSLRTAVKNLLMEYLFECSDMNTFPEYLLKVLSLINGSSRNTPDRFTLEEMEAEVECVLSVSAEIKQFIWDLIPDYDLGHDFADAYIEDLEDSDGGNVPSDNETDSEQEIGFPQSTVYDRREYTGEANQANIEMSALKVEGSGSSLTPNIRLNSDAFDRVESVHVMQMDFVDADDCASPTSSFKSISLENMEGNHFHACSVRNLEEHDQGLLHSKTRGSVSPSQLPHDARSNENHVDRQEPMIDAEKNQKFNSSNFTCEGNSMHVKPRMTINQYLAVQGACDKTSLFAYCFIGYVLDELAQIEGLYLDRRDISYLRGDNSARKDYRAVKEYISFGEEVHGSIILHVLEELLPSFPDRCKDKVNELLGLK